MWDWRCNFPHRNRAYYLSATKSMYIVQTHEYLRLILNFDSQFIKNKVYMKKPSSRIITEWFLQLTLKTPKPVDIKFDDPLVRGIAKYK